eukprot:206276-Pelagomonas_calceolata.AAC.1
MKSAECDADTKQPFLSVTFGGWCHPDTFLPCLPSVPATSHAAWCMQQIGSVAICPPKANPRFYN